MTIPLDWKVQVTGHQGMVGAAVVRALRARGHPASRLLLRSRTELDLCDGNAVNTLLQKEKPDLVIVAAARVGGIHANSTYPAEFIQSNLAVALNLVHGSYLAGVKRLLFLGSSCIYPRLAPQPMSEDCLLTSPLEPTNEPYAIAKIAGLKLCQYYRKQYGIMFHSAMPTNLYGPHDNYHPQNSHVLPALLRRFHEAREAHAPEVVLWGTGSPRREFLHVDDCADALLHLCTLDNPPDWVNVGYGEDISIRETAELVAETVGYRGKLVLDTSKPDGSPRKLLDITRLRATGWQPKITLREGLRRTYESFLAERAGGFLRQ
ncbi:MAG: GDP-L-fucose synthase [Opitutales bacterium]|jgi:GDP-L-fucose synthase